MGMLQWYSLTQSLGHLGLYTFPERICSKLNVIARLRFELAYIDMAIQYVNHADMKFGLVSLFNSILTFVGYLIPKLFSKKNSSGTI